MTVLLKTVGKDITEEGLRNVITYTGCEDKILNLRYIQRKRENFNQAQLIMASMKDARDLLDSLERSHFSSLSPMIEGSEESDTESPAMKNPPEEVFTLNQPFQFKNQLKDSSSSPSTSVQRLKSTIPSVLAMKESKESGKPALSQPRAVMAEYKESAQPRTSVKDSKVSAMPSISQPRAVLEELNQPSQIDDETFRARFIARMTQKNKQNENFLELSKAEVGHNVTESQATAEHKASDHSLSSEDSQPPFYRGGDVSWESPVESAVPTASVSEETTRRSHVSEETIRKFPESEDTTRRLPVSEETTRRLPVSEDTTRSSELNISQTAVPEVSLPDDRRVLSDPNGNVDVSRNYSNFGEVVAAGDLARETVDNSEEELWPMLPLTWVQAEIVEIIHEDMNRPRALPTFILSSQNYFYDVTLDPEEFELDAPWSEDIRRGLEENLTGQLLARRLRWSEEKQINVAELKWEDEGRTIGSILCRMSYLKRLRFDDLPQTGSLGSLSNEQEEEETDEVVTMDQLAAKIVLQDGCLVYFEGFGRSSNFARLLRVEESNKPLLEDIMLDTDAIETVSPQVGQIVAISEREESGGGDRYLRAEILKVKASQGKVLCQLVDHHGKRIVNTRDVHPLPLAASNIPPLCPELELAGVAGMSRGEAKEKIQPFLSMINDHPFILRIRREKVVELFGVNGESFNKILNEILEGEHDDKKPSKEKSTEGKKSGCRGNEEKEVEKREGAVGVDPRTIVKEMKDMKEKLKSIYSFMEEEEKKREVGKAPRTTGDDIEASLVGSGESLDVESFSSYRTLMLGRKIYVRVLHFHSWSNFFVCDEEQYNQLIIFQVSRFTLVILDI